MHLDEEGLDGAIEDQRVPQTLLRLAGWIAARKLEIAEPGRDLSGPDPAVPASLRLLHLTLSISGSFQVFSNSGFSGP